ncbi:MAG: methyl-accepting chemotaxis protein [candidate division WOR-3 bacterium]|nr:MAG: methyl-accepting chemotaxis protein [candidate division WOR-3 bacterium]
MKLQRRNYIVHKKFQFRMLGLLLILVFAATLFTTLINHYFFLSSIVHFIEQHGRPPTGSELIIASTKPLLIILPVAFIVLGIVCIFVSHRIAGPLYRLKMFMEKVENGDYTVNLRFRKGDAIHDVADSFNRMVDGIKQNFDQENKT